MELKTVFITGAGSGIGEATARRFHAEGWYVGLYGLHLDHEQRVADELGDRCHAGQVDVRDRNAVNLAFERFAQHTGGRLDALINNAGIFEDRLFSEADPEFLQRMMDINMNGVVHCLQAAYPLLKATPGAHAVNIGSSSSIYGTPNNAIYSSTKAFVRSLTEALRIEWATDDIVANVIMPSYTTTPMTQGVHLSHQTEAMLTVDEVVDAIWEAANSRGMYWLMPRSQRLYNFLLRKLPMQLGPWLADRLTYRNRKDRE